MNHKFLLTTQCFIIIVFFLFITNCKSKNRDNPIKTIDSSELSHVDKIKFTYQEVNGIGQDYIFNRRDNSWRYLLRLVFEDE